MARAEFAVLGAGALGSIIGAHLARAGHEVIMLARGRRARQLRADGLHLRGLADFSQPVTVLEDPAQFEGAQTLIMTTKTHDTAAALAPLLGARIGVAFSVQNGVSKDEALEQAFGREHVLGALANTSGELLADGQVLFTRNENIAIGELDGGSSERAQRIAGALDAAGVRTSAVTGILSLTWSKFASWAGMMALSVTTREVSWKYLSDPDTALVLARLVREVGALAAACGVALSDHSMLPVATICGGPVAQAVAAVQKVGAELKARAPRHRMSTLQDLESGRILEVEETVGYAVSKAAQLGLSLPLLESFYPLVAGIGHLRRLQDI